MLASDCFTVCIGECRIATQSRSDWTGLPTFPEVVRRCKMRDLLSPGVFRVRVSQESFAAYTRMEIVELPAARCHRRLLSNPHGERERVLVGITHQLPAMMCGLIGRWSGRRLVRRSGGVGSSTLWLVVTGDPIPVWWHTVASTGVVLNRPNQIRIRQRTPAELMDLAERAVYSGSPEHKVVRWWGGLPMGRQLPGGRVGRPRKETTICPLTSKSDRVIATEWVRAAIRSGQCRFYESDQNFPKKVWYEAGGQIWMGERINDGLGEYKGWPIFEEERDEVFGRMD